MNKILDFDAPFINLNCIKIKTFLLKKLSNICDQLQDIKLLGYSSENDSTSLNNLMIIYHREMVVSRRACHTRSTMEGPVVSTMSHPMLLVLLSTSVSSKFPDIRSCVIHCYGIKCVQRAIKVIKSRFFILAHYFKQYNGKSKLLGRPRELYI